jgi:branched-chain amino acid transport system substrate-binding protein
MTTKFRLLPLFVLAVLMLVSCSPKAANSDSEIVIGEYGSLTGKDATFGISTQNGVAMAVDALNKSGGVLGKQVKVLVEDDQGLPEQALTVVTKLITRDHVIAVLGEVASGNTLAAAPFAQKSSIPMISPSSTNIAVTQVGDYITRVCYIDPFQGYVMAKFATNTLKLKNVAILRDLKSPYSVGLADAFIENFKKMGGSIATDQSYSGGDSDFGAQLTSIKSKNPDGVFVPGYYTEVGLIALQSRKLGLNVPLLGGDGWDSPSLQGIGGDALNNSYFSNHYAADDPNPIIQKFVSEYRDRFKETPDGLAALGFDAANVLFDAIRRANTTEGPKLRDAIVATKDFPGVAGKITINKERNTDKPAVVIEINNNKFKYRETINP